MKKIPFESFIDKAEIFLLNRSFDKDKYLPTNFRGQNFENHKIFELELYMWDRSKNNSTNRFATLVIHNESTIILWNNPLESFLSLYLHFFQEQRKPYGCP